VLWFDSLKSALERRNAPTVGTIAELPVGLDNKKDLLEALARSLNFPDYFGHNWDALEECLRDLHWLPEGAVAVVHRDLPLSSTPADQDLYLEILVRAEMAWPAEGRELILIFPPNLTERVTSFY
jgi:RNAse (barnase) inhibitor barstar